mmetsp:Transcript_4179/g.4891  ORF Transcript_4179/g.4891 Transcript_4179/m.4891 type:complete len:255 (+) Transcript_4179:114-878(+)
MSVFKTNKSRLQYLPFKIDSLRLPPLICYSDSSCASCKSRNFGRDRSLLPVWFKRHRSLVDVVSFRIKNRIFSMRLVCVLNRILGRETDMKLRIFVPTLDVVEQRSFVYSFCTVYIPPCPFARNLHRRIPVDRSPPRHFFSVLYNLHNLAVVCKRPATAFVVDVCAVEPAHPHRSEIVPIWHTIVVAVNWCPGAYRVGPHDLRGLLFLVNPYIQKPGLLTDLSFSRSCPVNAGLVIEQEILPFPDVFDVVLSPP